MFRRNIQKMVELALKDTPVVVISGARQTGKSTFCEQLIKEGVFEAEYITLDDPTALAAAEFDPLAFTEGLKNSAIIDEVQRAPQLLLSIKKIVDKKRSARRFILTGSANVMMLPGVSESLAGRVELLNLWPLAMDEIAGMKSTFLNSLTSAKPEFKTSKLGWAKLCEMMTQGGYPEALERKTEHRRHRWFDSYINSILQKDIRELANIEGLIEIPNVLELISTRVGSILNLSEISRLSGIPKSTMQRYYALLKSVFLIVHLPAWTPNLEGRYTKAPKVYINDSGLLCYLRGEGAQSITRERNRSGAVLENFAVMEIIKQLSWSEQLLKPYHFRAHNGREVDIVLEDRKKNLFGIEIKATSGIDGKAFKGLGYLKDLSPKHFSKGVVLYTGEQVVKFADNMYAVPISALWS